MNQKLSLFLRILVATVIIIITIVMTAHAAQAQKYYFDEPNTLLNIDECEGPIKVRMSSYYRLQDNEINIIGCTLLSNYVYDCDCDAGSKELEFQVSSNYSNAYNFDILYYLEHWHIDKRVFDENSTWQERNPTEEEIALDNNLREVQIKGIMLREPKKLFNIKFNMTLGSILLSCVVVVIGGSMFAFKHFKSKLDKDNNIDQGEDMFNYSTKDTDKTFDKLIDKIEQDRK